MITAEIQTRSLVNFCCQYAGRHMNLTFMRHVSERERASRQFVIVKNKLSIWVSTAWQAVEGEGKGQNERGRITHALPPRDSRARSYRASHARLAWVRLGPVTWREVHYRHNMIIKYDNNLGQPLFPNWLEKPTKIDTYNYTDQYYINLVFSLIV